MEVEDVKEEPPKKIARVKRGSKKTTDPVDEEPEPVVEVDTEAVEADVEGDKRVEPAALAAQVEKGGVVGSVAAEEAAASGPAKPASSPAARAPEAEDSEDDGDETIRLDAPPLIQETAPTPGPSTPLRASAARASSSTPVAPPLSPSAPAASQDPAPPKGPTPRLTIHKIVLVDFKSYANRQEIGPFHKSFSAIVGPNGSGKSNTIDALLFVFGYRASKMRQGKLSELIHNSAGKEGIESCSVEVWFREIVDLVSSRQSEKG